MTSREERPLIGSTVSTQRRPVGAMKRRRPNQRSESCQHWRRTRQESPSISRSRRLIASPDCPAAMAMLCVRSLRSARGVPARGGLALSALVRGVWTSWMGGRVRGTLTVPSQRQVVHHLDCSSWVLEKWESAPSQRAWRRKVSVPQRGQLVVRGSVR